MLKLRIDGRPCQLAVTPGMSLLQAVKEQLLAVRDPARHSSDLPPKKP
jgi:hypothetical protein